MRSGKVAQHLPSEFDNCTKLDVLRGEIRVQAPRQALRHYHPDAIHSKTALDASHSSLFAYESVRFDEQSQHWLPSHRYVCASYERVHSVLMRKDIPLRWKNAYECLVSERCRHLYFDLEASRPPEVLLPDDVGNASVVASWGKLREHESLCWRKVQTLKTIVSEVFECATFLC